MSTRHEPKTDLATQSLTDIFRASAAQYHDAFPKTLDNFFVVVDGDVIYATPQFSQEAPLTKDSIVRELMDLMEAEGDSGRAIRAYIGDAPFIALGLHEGVSSGRVSTAPSPEINKILDFDHEMGHALVPGGWDAPSLSTREGAAAAFAALRHVQRFGPTTDIFEAAPAWDAINLVLQPSEHAAMVFTVQKVASLVKQGLDVASLSLRETAELAGDIAAEYVPEQAMMDKVSVAYARPRAHYEKTGRADIVNVIKSVAQVALENKDDDDIYRFGRLFLSRQDVRGHIATATGDDAKEFARIERAMKRHEEESGFTLNAAEAMDAEKKLRTKKSKAPPLGPKA